MTDPERSPRFALVALIVFLVIAATVSIALRGPAPKPATADPSAFSAARAMAELTRFMRDDIPRSIGTSEHEAGWERRFLDVVRRRPEVLEAHRLAGDVDYILKVWVKNARAYDAFYQALIAEVRIYNVTALLSMEEIKSTTMLPL